MGYTKGGIYLRIARFTLDGYFNYGNLLQNYALQYVIKKYAADVDSVWSMPNNFLPQSWWRWSWKEPIKWFINWKGFRDNFKIGHFGIEMARQARMRDFADRYINYRYDADLTSLDAEYDYFVVGSDQVWNPMLLGGDYYTLTWVDSRRPKVTYASSFGVSEIPASQVKKTKEYLSRFNMISVREEQGAEIVEKLTRKKAEVCCDPTVLTDRKRWDELSGDCPFVSEKYIFCYFIGNNPSQREFAKKLAQKTGCKILAVKHIDEYIKSDDDFGDIDYLEVGPKEFVNFIRYATYVCTDSFHGTIFSIMYNKNFFTFMRFSDSQKSSMNSRVKNILSIVGLSNRLFENSITPEAALAYQVDWSDVNKRLNDFRKSSREYFERAIICLKGTQE